MALRIVSCARELSEFLLKRAQISEMRPITANTRPTFAGLLHPMKYSAWLARLLRLRELRWCSRKFLFDFSVFMMPTFLMKKLSFLKYRGKENICILSVCRNVYIRTEELTIPISEITSSARGWIAFCRSTTFAVVGRSPRSGCELACPATHHFLNPLARLVWGSTGIFWSLPLKPIGQVNGSPGFPTKAPCMSLP